MVITYLFTYDGRKKTGHCFLVYLQWTQDNWPSLISLLMMNARKLIIASLFTYDGHKKNGHCLLV